MKPNVLRILIPYHLLLVCTAWYLPTVSLDSLLVFLVFWILIGGLGIEVGFHRTVSHNFDLVHPWTRHFFTFLGTLGLSTSSIFWAAVHGVLHHPFADQSTDPHSPKRGKWVSYIGWTNDSLPGLNFKRIRKEILRDNVQQFFHKNYYGINYAFSAICILIDARLYFTGILLAQLASLHQALAVNLICHNLANGYRSFPTPDNSINIRWLSLFTFGLSLHNNHHFNPKEPKFSVAKGEFDLGYFLVKPFLAKKK